MFIGFILLLIYLAHLVEMFRRLNSHINGFADAADFKAEQRTLYQTSLPNIIPVPDEKAKDGLKGVVNALKTVNPITRTVKTEGVDVYNYAMSTEIPENVRAMMRACETAQLDQLITNQNPHQTVRCAWIYEKGPSGTAPKQSRGVLGTSAGPLAFTGVQTAAANYYWDPLEAQKIMARDRCAELVTCENVENSDYAGKCAYDPIKGRGVPIFPNGQLMFPNDPSLSANPANLIRKRGQCPPPPPPGSPAAEFQQSRDVCAPLSNGTLSRDCIIQQVRTAGCQDQGALMLALQSPGSLNDYSANLRKSKSYSVYQQRASVPLLETVIKDGSTSKDVALSNFRALASESSKSDATGLQAAARDMCIKTGTLDGFDFCSELTDTTLPPYTIECLRKEWTKRGGLATGALYPSEATLASYWNKIPTWGMVLRDMGRLASEVRDVSYKGETKEAFADMTAEQRQRTALKSFYGIERQPPPPKQIAAMAGVEVFWIDMTTNTFLGRVISNAPPVIDAAGQIPIVNKADNVQMVLITNVRPAEDGLWRIGAITDDGVSVRVNKNYKPVPVGTTVNSADEMSRYYIQPPTKHVNDACWELVKGGPNIIIGDWYEAAGHARFELFAVPCQGQGSASAQAQVKIPADVYTLTQEGDAPYLSYEYVAGAGLRERRLPALFESPHNGGAYLGTDNVRLMRNGWITLKKPVLVNSWRSLTVHFTPYVKPSDRQVFMSYGSLFEIYFQDAKTYVKFSGPSVTKTISWDTGYEVGETYIFHVNMRSSFEGSVPDIMTFGVMPRSWYAAGKWRGGIELRMPKNQPLYNMTDNHTFTFGSDKGLVSADAGIKSVRLFDYELDASDLARDASNKWVRQWIGEKV